MTNHQSKLRPIIAIGDLTADLIVSIPTLPVEAGRHQLAEEMGLEPGGAANFLITGARLGYPMAALGALGDDVWGRQVAALIRAEGIDLAQVRQAGTTTQVVVLVSQAGDHVFLGQYGRGARIDFTPADAALIEKSGAIFCTGYTLAETRLVDLTLEALRLARQANRPIFFDPGPQLAGAPPAVWEAVRPLINTLLLTEEEIPLVTAGEVVDLLRDGMQTVVVKRGPAGCLVYTRERPRTPVLFPGYPVDVVDTSAAGDSFNAAFIVAALWGWPLANRARLANAAGAAKAAKLGGGRNVPTLAEIQAINSEFEIGLEIGEDVETG